MTAIDSSTGGTPPSTMCTIRQGLLVFLVFGLAIAGAMAAMLPGSTLHLSVPSAGIPFWFWGCGALLPLLINHGRLDAWMAQHRSAGAWVAFAICVAVVFAALHANLTANLGVYDDHEILNFLGPGQRHCHWKQWPALLMKTEVGTFGASARYRPLYYAVRIAECCLWGKYAYLWYAARIALCATMLALLWRTVERWWGASLAFVFVLLILGLTATVDTYSRLGPAEAYAMPAIALGIWAWSKALLRGSASSPWLWWAGASGFAAAELCKENFVPIAGLAIITGSCVLWRGQSRRSPGAWASLAGLTLITAMMLLIIVRMLVTTGGHDVYSNEVNGASIMQSLGRSTLRLLLGGPLLVLLPLLGWSLWEARRHHGPDATRQWRLSPDVTIFLALALAAWFSQAVFYRNIDWPSATRYDFPAVLVPFVVMIAGMRRLLQMPWVVHQRRAVGHAAVLFILLLAAGDGLVNGVMAQSKLSASHTRHYASWMHAIVRAAKSDPQASVILVPDHPLAHYEPVVSVSRYLKYNEIPNPVLYTTKCLVASNKASPLEKTLLLQIQKGSWSIAGLQQADDKAWPANALLIPFGDHARTQLIESGDKPFPKTFNDTLK